MRSESAVLAAAVSLLLTTVGVAGPIIIDHRHTDITALRQRQIDHAKSNLHIAYGHTSHGSQLTTGMTGLVAFANGGGKGLSLATDTFAWNNGGVGGALDLHDYAMGGDVGYYPQWVNNTRSYLDNPANSDVNVIIWSWCGQVDSKYAAGVLDDEYLDPMTQLEIDYPDVTFVYMTGHVDIWDDANNKAANQMIRDYCQVNGKVLYDFADVERYDPDGTYYEFVNDNCNYYGYAGGPSHGNWATEWQSAHIEGYDWYSCSSAHSQPLNANQKAYAAWSLWTGLGQAMAPSSDCNCDGLVDIDDLDFLRDALGEDLPAVSMDGDGDLDVDDIETWLTLNGKQWGDLDLNGTTSFVEAATVVANIGMTNAGSWADGDLDGDGLVTVADGQLAVGALPSEAAELILVPEPGAAAALSGFLFMLATTRGGERRRLLARRRGV